MRMLSIRHTIRHRGRWNEKIELISTENAPTIGSGMFVISRCEVALPGSHGLGLVHWTTLDPTAAATDIMQNRDATVVHLPHDELDGTISAAESLDPARFWRLVDGLGPSYSLMLCSLRRRLARASRIAVPFQRRLIELSSSLMTRRDATWTQAMSVVLLGEASYADALAGMRPLPLEPNLDPADVTDIAEDIVGHRIVVPGYGADAVPSAVTRRRWLSWRAVARREDSRIEAFYFGERPPGVSIRAMLPRVRQTMKHDGLEPEENIETWIPDGLRTVPHPYMVVYNLSRPGGEDRKTHFLRMGLPRSGGAGIVGLSNST